MDKLLTDIGLKYDLINTIKASGLGNLNRGLRGIDLAAGTCWSAGVLFQKLNIDEMIFLEFSEHRITKLAPLVLEHYNIPPEKVKLVLGSFYEIKEKEESIDFVVLSQALHHAEDVGRLLGEAHRVLKKGGKVIIIGEPYVEARQVRQYAWRILKDISRLNTSSEQIQLYRQYRCLYYDRILGDRKYSLFGYGCMFRKHGFHYNRIRTWREDSHLSFLLTKK